MRLLILRPEPGASETAARARALGLEAILAPLFAIRPLPGETVDAALYEAVLVTSANGARHAPPGLTHLPCFAVGGASAEAARSAGFGDVRTGPSDAAAAAAMMAEAGVRRALHPCGRDHVPPAETRVRIDPNVVYAAEPLPWRGFEGPVVAMVHSPRAAARLARLVTEKQRVAIAAISAAAAAAAGDGWASKRVAPAPRDAALLELAAKLCNTGFEAAKDEGDGI